jgi:hypothetical protein
MVATRVLFIFGGIILGLAILMASGVGLLPPILEEISNEGRANSELGEDIRDNNEDDAESGNGISKVQKIIKEHNSLWLFSIPFLRIGQENEGNGFTGQAAGWLFGISCLPVAFCVSMRLINRKSFLPAAMKGSLERFSRANKKYFMPFHTYLSLLGLIIGIVHFIFSTCPNPLPEWGLIMAGVLVATGLMIKYRIAAKLFPKFVKRIYQFHASLVVSGILIAILLAGHVIMD